MGECSMQLLKVLLFSLLLLMAPNISAQTSSDTQEQLTYFLGEVKMSSPAGQPYGSSISLVRRALKPAENKIVEQVLSLDPKQPPQEYTTVFDIKGSKFTVKDEEGSFAGEGELMGKAWEWTGWKYNVSMLGQRKGSLKAEDTLNRDGLVVKKSFYTPDGQLRVLFSEDLKPISKEMYEILRAKLLQK